MTKDDVKKYYSNNYEYSEQINFATDFDDLICNIAIKDPQKFFSNEVVKQWLSNNIIGLECTKSGTIKQDNFSELFKNYSSLYYVDISKINLSDVLSMEDMFYGCSNLTDLAADWQNTINCTDMSGLFYNCSSLKNITSLCLIYLIIVAIFKQLHYLKLEIILQMLVSYFQIVKI